MHLPKIKQQKKKRENSKGGKKAKGGESEWAMRSLPFGLLKSSLEFLPAFIQPEIKIHLFKCYSDFSTESPE